MTNTLSHPKVAVVTGRASGIGFAMAARFADIRKGLRNHRAFGHEYAPLRLHRASN
jgi:NAD(P)-dependent dehydrogenase (short-subunit alcohol dehydrogenase family)